MYLEIDPAGFRDLLLVRVLIRGGIVEILPWTVRSIVSSFAGASEGRAASLAKVPSLGTKKLLGALRLGFSNPLI